MILDGIYCSIVVYEEASSHNSCSDNHPWFMYAAGPEDQPASRAGNVQLLSNGQINWWLVRRNSAINITATGPETFNADLYPQALCTSATTCHNCYISLLFQLKFNEKYYKVKKIIYSSYEIAHLISVFIYCGWKSTFFFSFQ